MEDSLSYEMDVIEMPQPIQIVDVYPAHLPLTELVNLAIQVTCIGLQKHEVSKIVLNPVIKDVELSTCK
jgi:hypothetical protein